MRIWRIAVSGVFIAVVVLVLVISISHRSQPPDQPSLLQPPPAVAPSNHPSSSQQFTFFSFDTDSLTLVSEERELHVSQEITERLKQIITELLDHATNGLQQTIPNNTFLYEVYVDDQSIAYLNFSHHLKDRHIGGTTAEILTVETILKTVQANFRAQIKKVQILIEGLEVDTIAGHIDISKPLALLPEPVNSAEENVEISPNSR
ncbi:MAG: GerMN domain-containing protein [Candidatus Poribacteria bacterium]|nr:GerMN domain-containing protein [Candidatus Poribacteria bacterium]